MKSVVAFIFLFSSAQTHANSFLCFTHSHHIRVHVSKITDLTAEMKIIIGKKKADVRIADIGGVYENGRKLLAFGAMPGTFSPDNSVYVLYTNGSTTDEITEAVFADVTKDQEIELHCRQK